MRKAKARERVSMEEAEAIAVNQSFRWKFRELSLELFPYHCRSYRDFDCCKCAVVTNEKGSGAGETFTCAEALALWTSGGWWCGRGCGVAKFGTDDVVTGGPLITGRGEGVLLRFTCGVSFSPAQTSKSGIWCDAVARMAVATYGTSIAGSSRSWSGSAGVECARRNSACGVVKWSKNRSAMRRICGRRSFFTISGRLVRSCLWSVRSAQVCYRRRRSRSRRRRGNVIRIHKKLCLRSWLTSRRIRLVMLLLLRSYDGF